jgi:hypothetical protein
MGSPVEELREHIISTVAGLVARWQDVGADRQMPIAERFT